MALQDTIRVNEALTEAYNNAPNEGAMAIHRINLAVALKTDLSDEARLILRRDVALLVQGHRTRSHIARMYLRRGAPKDLIISVVNQQSKLLQHAFLASVKEASS